MQRYKDIPLTQIVAPPERYMRATDCVDTVAYYADLMQRQMWEWEHALYVPPLVLFDGQQYHLARGYLRYRAAQQARLPEIRCRIQSGTADDALRHAAQILLGDDSFGLVRTKEDATYLVHLALQQQHYYSQTNRRLATWLPLSEHSINRQRQLLEDAGLIPRRILHKQQRLPRGSSCFPQGSVSELARASCDTAPPRKDQMHTITLELDAPDFWVQLGDALVASPATAPLWKPGVHAAFLDALQEMSAFKVAEYADAKHQVALREAWDMVTAVGAAELFYVGLPAEAVPSPDLLDQLKDIEPDTLVQLAECLHVHARLRGMPAAETLVEDESRMTDLQAVRRKMHGILVHVRACFTNSEPWTSPDSVPCGAGADLDVPCRSSADSEDSATHAPASDAANMAGDAAFPAVTARAVATLPPSSEDVTDADMTRGVGGDTAISESTPAWGSGAPCGHTTPAIASADSMDQPSPLVPALVSAALVIHTDQIIAAHAQGQKPTKIVHHLTRGHKMVDVEAVRASVYDVLIPHIVEQMNAHTLLPVLRSGTTLSTSEQAQLQALLCAIANTQNWQRGPAYWKLVAHVRRVYSTTTNSACAHDNGVTDDARLPCDTA